MRFYEIVGNSSPEFFSIEDLHNFVPFIQFKPLTRYL